MQHCRDNLTNYKVPKVIEFRDELLVEVLVAQFFRLTHCVIGGVGIAHLAVNRELAGGNLRAKSPFMPNQCVLDPNRDHALFFFSGGIQVFTAIDIRVPNQVTE